MGSPSASTRSSITGAASEHSFRAVFIAFLAATCLCGFLAYHTGDKRRNYEEQQYIEIANQEPKGETSKADEPGSLTIKKTNIRDETTSLQKEQDAYLNVFIGGIGALTGLATGRKVK